MILIIVVIFWHLPSRSRARKSRLYLNYRRRSQEELIPCAAQRCNSHRSPPSPIFAANRFWTLESSPKNFFGCSSSDLRPRNSLSRGDSKKLARHRNLSLFAINNKMLCNVMLTYFYLNSYIVWLKSSYSLYWLIDSPFLANMFSLFIAEREKDLTIFCLFTALPTTPADFRSQIIWQQKCSGFWNLMIVDIFNDYNNHDNLSTHHLHCLLVPTDSCLKMKTEQPRCSLFGIPCMPTTVFFSLMNWIYLFGPFPRGLFSETFHIETASRQPIFGYIT